MDKNSNNTVLALSGQKDCIRKLMYLNPELNYRFSSMLNFNDYSKEELINMALGILESKGYILDENSRTELTNTIGELYINKNLTLKNALMVKQYLDILIREQSIRICDIRINSKEMNLIITEDLIKSKEKFILKNIYK